MNEMSSNVRTIRARYAGRCLICLQKVQAGDLIDWNVVTRSVVHAAATLCPPETAVQDEPREVDPDLAYERWLEREDDRYADERLYEMQRDTWREDLEMARMDAEAERRSEILGAWSSMR
jgi:hypothetical protein